MKMNQTWNYMAAHEAETKYLRLGYPEKNLLIIIYVNLLNTDFGELFEMVFNCVEYTMTYADIFNMVNELVIRRWHSGFYY